MTAAAAEPSVDQIVGALERDGYCVLEHFWSAKEVSAAKESLEATLAATPRGRNDFEGHKTQRVYAVFAKTRAFDEAAINPVILSVLDRVLGHYHLSAPVGIQIGPGEKEQVLHYDQSIYPLPRTSPDVVINTMWALDDFTLDNGATRLVAGSHTWLDRRPTAADRVIQAEMPAGSVLIYSGKIWHGGGANHTDRPRLGVILEYVAGWLRQQESHLLAVPRDVVAMLPERLQELLGYNIYPPFVGYVDGRHPRSVLGRGKVFDGG